VVTSKWAEIQASESRSMATGCAVAPRPEPLASSGAVGQGESPRRRGSRSPSGFAKHLVVPDPVVDDEPFHPRRDNRWVQSAPANRSTSLTLDHVDTIRYSPVSGRIGRPIATASRPVCSRTRSTDTAANARSNSERKFGPNAHVKEGVGPTRRDCTAGSASGGLVLTGRSVQRPTNCGPSAGVASATRRPR
jgi:hypothetical protein